MALGDSYATVAEFEGYLGSNGEPGSLVAIQAEITDSLATASREIERWCGRQFNTSGVATARVFQPQGSCYLWVDDFHTSTGLVVKTDANNDGTYETTVTASSYRLEPLNGIVDGQTGWPYYRIYGVGGYTFPNYGYPAVQVTANWGWSAVPPAVKQACIIIANENLKVAREAPFGVAGRGDFGAIRIRDNPRVQSMLAGYRRFAGVVA